MFKNLLFSKLSKLASYFLVVGVGLTSFVFAGCLCLPLAVSAGTARVAVASNFSIAAKALAQAYQSESGHAIVLITASTGKLYAQILHGGPYDVFLSADSLRVTELARHGLSVPHSQTTYALGAVVFYSSQKGRFDASASPIFTLSSKEKLAIANAKTAPYGRAAEQVLQAMGLAEPLADRIVRGENIAQTFQFVSSGNAAIGIVARSQALLQDKGSCWPIPQELFDPVMQDAVLLTRGANNPAAVGFMSFLKSSRGQSIIQNHGYNVGDYIAAKDVVDSRNVMSCEMR